MEIGRFLGFALACVLGACVTGSSGSAPVGEPPPRLAVPVEERQGIASLPSPCGLTLVGNVDELHFRMELTGERIDVSRDQASDVYVVDGLRVQVRTVGAHEIAPAAREQRGVGLLRMHVIWESARVSEILGREVEPEEVAIRSSDNMPAAVVWWLPIAGSDAAAVHADAGSDGGGPDAPVGLDAGTAAPKGPTGLAFMTAAYGQRVLVLSVQGLHGEPKSALLAKAETWMATVTTSPQVIWTAQVSAELKAASAAGQSCPGRPNAVFAPSM